MSWFKKDPPPPPKKTISDWTKIFIPIIFAIIIGLLGIVYNGLAEEVKTKADKEFIEEKLNNFEERIQNFFYKIDEQNKKEIIKQPSYDSPPQQQMLSPKEFQDFKKLSPEDKRDYIKYRNNQILSE